jgi:pimeloyl-ACP methyl ester carboxylesterase
LNAVWVFVALSIQCGCGAALVAQETKAVETRLGDFLSVPGSAIYYQEGGSAPQTVVLLHDGVLDSAVWDEVWSELCKKFHVVRYDRRGYGRSPASSEGYWETDDLAALLRRLKIARGTIVGSSHGGEISIDFALAHPEMVQQLVLVGAVLGGMPYSALSGAWRCAGQTVAEGRHPRSDRRGAK